MVGLGVYLWFVFWGLYWCFDVSRSGNNVSFVLGLLGSMWVLSFGCYVFVL